MTSLQESLDDAKDQLALLAARQYTECFYASLRLHQAFRGALSEDQIKRFDLAVVALLSTTVVGKPFIRRQVLPVVLVPMTARRVSTDESWVEVGERKASASMPIYEVTVRFVAGLNRDGKWSDEQRKLFAGNDPDDPFALKAWPVELANRKSSGPVFIAAGDELTLRTVYGPVDFLKATNVDELSPIRSETDRLLAFDNAYVIKRTVEPSERWFIYLTQAPRALKN